MTLGRHLVLIGMPGSGKTTVGRSLAALLSVAVVSVDDRIEAAAGMTVVEIFAKRGEAEFRRRESEELAIALTHDPAVIDTGGGLPESAGNRAVMAQAKCRCVYLRADAGLLGDRVGAGGGRPMLSEGGSGRLEEMLARREPLYSEIADCIVDIRRNLAPADIAFQIKGMVDEIAQD